MKVLFLWKPLISSVKGEIWRIVVVFLGGISWRSLRTFIFEPDTRVEVLVVLDVIDVLVSPSSVVTELCEVSSCCSDWEFVNRSPFLSPKSGFGQLRSKR